MNKVTNLKTFTFNLFSKCIATDKTSRDKILLVKPCENTFFFDLDKVERNSEAIYALTIFFDRLNEGILFSEFNTTETMMLNSQSKAKNKWTELNQHKEILLGLFMAADMVKCTYEKDDIKIKLKQKED